MSLSGALQREIAAPPVYRVRPFAAADYAALRAPQRGEVGTLLGAGLADPLAVGTDYQRHGQGFTLFRDGCRIGCAGIMVQWPGLGIAWAHVRAPETWRGRAEMLACFAEKFPDLLAAMRLRRVQADVSRGWGPGERLVQRLGFYLEGEMPCYGPSGETFGRWVILPPMVDVPCGTP